MLNDISSSSLADKIDNLRQTRDLLLPKLISGEIDVSDLDIKMREPA
jgi:type I restriction enzyme S subunit